MERYDRTQLEIRCREIKPSDPVSMAAARRNWDGIAKPLYGLGCLEDMLVKIAGIQETEDIRLSKKAVVVFCSDNGIVEEGVTQTDSSVTAVVTENFARGTASVNRIAAVAGADVIPVDVGVASDLKEPGIYNCKIGYGTGDFLKGPAMTEDQAVRAIHTGITLAGELKRAGYDLLAVGEMGIGNTTTSSAVTSVLLGLPVEAVTGRGAGLSDAGLSRKIQVIRQGIALHRPDPEQPVSLLAALGGYDMAAMAGFLLGGAIFRIPVVLDGMISGVSALLAQKMCGLATDYMLASHLGKEPVCQAALDRLGLIPVIHGRLALGEGTGAAMLFPLLDMAEAVYRENNTFENNEIAAYRHWEEEPGR